MDKHLHIISFTIPYPPNYGGVIDVYYKIKTLYQLGVKVHLHCFQYGREQAEKLEQICHTVHYYPRKHFFRSIYTSVPYIINSRQSDELLSILTQDDHPVLFEGLHTCFYLEHPALKERVKAVRMHNIEWDYYKSLGKAERNFFRKFYFFSESYKLKHFEKSLTEADLLLAVSPSDETYLRSQYNGKVRYLGAFHANEFMRTKPGKGHYAIYHGNLGVVENNQAAVYLVEKIFSELPYNLIIAGKNPSPVLQKLVQKYENIELREDVSDEEMDHLIREAQMNVLPSFQDTGIKLKLINALYQGRHVIVNAEMVRNNELGLVSHVVYSAGEMRQKVNQLFEQPFTEDDVNYRQKVLADRYSNQAQAKNLIQWIYSPNQ